MPLLLAVSASSVRALVLVVAPSSTADGCGARWASAVFAPSSPSPPQAPSSPIRMVSPRSFQLRCRVSDRSVARTAESDINFPRVRSPSPSPGLARLDPSTLTNAPPPTGYASDISSLTPSQSASQRAAASTETSPAGRALQAAESSQRTLKAEEEIFYQGHVTISVPPAHAISDLDLPTGTRGPAQPSTSRTSTSTVTHPIPNGHVPGAQSDFAATSMAAFGRPHRRPLSRHISEVSDEDAHEDDDEPDVHDADPGDDDAVLDPDPSPIINLTRTESQTGPTPRPPSDRKSESSDELAHGPLQLVENTPFSSVRSKTAVVLRPPGPGEADPEPEDPRRTGQMSPNSGLSPDSVAVKRERRTSASLFGSLRHLFRRGHKSPDGPVAVWEGSQATPDQSTQKGWVTRIDAHLHSRRASWDSELGVDAGARRTGGGGKGGVNGRSSGALSPQPSKLRKGRAPAVLKRENSGRTSMSGWVTDGPSGPTGAETGMRANSARGKAKRRKKSIAALKGPDAGHTDGEVDHDPDPDSIPRGLSSLKPTPVDVAGTRRPGSAHARLGPDLGASTSPPRSSLTLVHVHAGASKEEKNAKQMDFGESSSVDITRSIPTAPCPDQSLMSIVEGVVKANEDGQLRSCSPAPIMNSRVRSLPSNGRDRALLQIPSGTMPGSSSSLPDSLPHWANLDGDVSETTSSLASGSGSGSGSGRILRNASRPAKSPLRSALRTPRSTGPPSPNINDKSNATTSRSDLAVAVAPGSGSVQATHTKPHPYSAAAWAQPERITLPPPSPDGGSSSVSVSSYETGHESLLTASVISRSPTSPPPSMSLAQSQSTTPRSAFPSTMTTTPGMETPTEIRTPSRRKSVRMSLQPTFSTTPPALYDPLDEDEFGVLGERGRGRGPGRGGENGSGRERGRGRGGRSVASASVLSSTAGRTGRARDAGKRDDVWQDSGSEDEVYSRARMLLSRVGTSKSKA